ncbi:MAG: site-specific integrase [Methylacidiphilales bacterium]|nr:site-specific integrase [Candidatus Methylacidiphilales bacterium]
MADPRPQLRADAAAHGAAARRGAGAGRGRRCPRRAQRQRARASGQGQPRARSAAQPHRPRRPARVAGRARGAATKHQRAVALAAAPTMERQRSRTPVPRAVRAGRAAHHPPHILRHTFATRLIASGIGIERVATLLGHARLDATRIYTAPTWDDLAGAVEHLG